MRFDRFMQTMRVFPITMTSPVKTIVVPSQDALRCSYFVVVRACGHGDCISAGAPLVSELGFAPRDALQTSNFTMSNMPGSQLYTGSPFVSMAW
jgi:hypothetical protein